MTLVNLDLSSAKAFNWTCLNLLFGTVKIRLKFKTNTSTLKVSILLHQSKSMSNNLSQHNDNKHNCTYGQSSSSDSLNPLPQTLICKPITKSKNI